MNNGIGFIITPKHLAPRILIPAAFPFALIPTFFSSKTSRCIIVIVSEKKSLDNRYKHIFNHILYIHRSCIHVYIYISYHIKLKVNWSLIISTSVIMSFLVASIHFFTIVSFYKKWPSRDQDIQDITKLQWCAAADSRKWSLLCPPPAEPKKQHCGPPRGKRWRCLRPWKNDEKRRRC